jgi:serine protease AprX
LPGAGNCVGGELIIKLISLFFVFVLVIVAFTPAPKASFPGWQSKVDAWVTDSASAGEAEFIIFLSEQADLSGAAALNTKLEKGNYVFQRLTEVARRTQGPVIASLKNQGSEYRPFWVANMIWARGGLSLVQSMAMRGDVAHIYANPWVKLEEEPSSAPRSMSPSLPGTIEWNIQKVNADDVWAAGFTGQGAVIAGQDTGYAWQHPALIRQYRGWDGATANHNYNWHDAIHSGGVTGCPANSVQPCDDYGHGTHTMGTMLGDDGQGNQIGMAPGARWIGCRNMNLGVGTPATYAECYQWFIAPTDLNDQNPRPDLAPDVINNSWSCPPSEGCTDPNVLLAVVNNVRAAGILTAHSAGNSGSYCSTVSDPAAIYDASFSVGATDNTDTIASFSSRGPVTVDGSNRLKPDISAPGVNVRSSLRTGGYGTMSGTSMAAPHVAGLVALLISASPVLHGQADVLENLIDSTALPRTTTQSCGDVPGTNIPNNTYGWGRIDAFAAFQAARRRYDLWLIKTASANQIAPGSLLTYTLTVTNTNYISPTYDLVLTDTLPSGTSLVSSSVPFSFSNQTVTWENEQLSPGAAWRINLSVAVSGEAGEEVVNSDYSASSAEVEQPVYGPPVTTPIRLMYYFPVAVR